MAKPWSIVNVPVLLEDGSNAVVWRLIVSVVAAQHDALEFLEREPTPNNAVEESACLQLKTFLVLTCCEKYQPCLGPLTALQSWEMLSVIVKPSIPVTVPVPLTPAAATNGTTATVPLTLNTLAVVHSANSTPKQTPKQVFLSPSPLVSASVAINSIMMPASRYAMPPPEGYPVRDASIPAPPATPLLLLEEEDDIKDVAEKLRKCHSAPAKLLLSSSEHVQPMIPISKFKPNVNRRKALIIGINYSGGNSLGGCVRDAIFLCYLLLTRYDFKPGDITLMVDEQLHYQGLHGVKTGKPTRENIMDAMTWLLRDAVAGDSLFFSFSGHGKQVPDISGDEISGWDQAICTLGDDEILDDTLYDMLVRRVPRGARLTAVVDACYSGTVLDLPYMYDLSTGIRHDARVADVDIESSTAGGEDVPEKISKRKRFRNSLSKMKEKLLSPSKKNKQEVEGMSGADSMNVNVDLSNLNINDNHCECSDCEEMITAHTLASREYAPHPDSKGGMVCMISGCHNKEFSTESEKSGETTGLMSFSFIEVLERGRLADPKEYTYKKLLKEMEEKVTSWATDQSPQFSTSHPFNLNSAFVL